MVGGLWQGKQGTSMTHRYLALSDELLDLVVEVKQADVIGDGGSILAEAVASLFLGQGEAGEITGIG